MLLWNTNSTYYVLIWARREVIKLFSKPRILNNARAAGEGIIVYPRVTKQLNNNWSEMKLFRFHSSADVRLLTYSVYSNLWLANQIAVFSPSTIIYRKTIKEWVNKYMYVKVLAPFTFCNRFVNVLRSY